jgi:hypothetical protein
VADLAGQEPHDDLDRIRETEGDAGVRPPRRTVELGRQHPQHDGEVRRRLQVLRLERHQMPAALLVRRPGVGGPLEDPITGLVAEVEGAGQLGEELERLTTIRVALALAFDQKFSEVVQPRLGLNHVGGQQRGLEVGEVVVDRPVDRPQPAGFLQRARESSLEEPSMRQELSLDLGGERGGRPRPRVVRLRSAAARASCGRRRRT